MNFPTTGTLMVDTGLALVLFIAGVWIFLKNWNKWGLVVIVVTLVWAWGIYDRYYR